MIVQEDLGTSRGILMLDKKMSYFDTIEYMLKNEQELGWDYYHCHNDCKKVEDVFDYPKSYIGETFIHAKKQLLISTNHSDRHSFNGPNISHARAAHSISSFFTGMILAKGLLGDNQNSFCNLYGTANGMFPFAYVWNLTCLYHDFGYEFEKNVHNCEIVKNEINRSAERIPIPNGRLKFPEFNGYSLTAVSKVFSIKKSYLSMGKLGLFNKDNSAEARFILHFVRTWKSGLLCNGGPVKIPHRSGMLIERYLNYRLFGRMRGCLDHGIMGGLSFFNLIIDNYIREYFESRRVSNNHNFTNFEVMNVLDNPLQITIEQTILFAYIADCIVNHNIWKCQKGCEHEYRTFGLDALIGSKFEKIDFYTNPLLFILVMSDCLEPYKNYCDVCFGHGIDYPEFDKNEALSIFKGYRLTVVGERIVITVPDSCVVACENKLKDMQDWISIKSIKQRNKFYITPIRA